MSQYQHSTRISWLRLAVTTLIVLLSPRIASAAVALDSARFVKDWDQLVNRVSCEYVKSYMESIVSNPNMGDEAQAFCNNVVPHLYANGRYLTTDQLIDTLGYYNWTATAAKLVQPIADRKQLPNSKRTLDRLLDINTFSATMQSYLEHTQQQLRDGISQEYANTVATTGSITDTTANRTNKTIESVGRPVARDYDLIIFILALAIVVEALLIARLTSRRRIVKTIRDSDLMRRTYISRDDDDIAELHHNMNRLQKQIDRLSAPADTPTSDDNNSDTDAEDADTDEGAVQFKHL